MTTDKQDVTLSPEEVKARVDVIRAEKHAQLNPKHNPQRGIAGRMVADFASGVAVGCGIGWWLDKQFDTSPLWIMIFLIFGMLGGFLNMYRTYNRSNSEKN